MRVFLYEELCSEHDLTVIFFEVDTLMSVVDKPSALYCISWYILRVIVYYICFKYLLFFFSLAGLISRWLLVVDSEQQQQKKSQYEYDVLNKMNIVQNARF